MVITSVHIEHLVKRYAVGKDTITAVNDVSLEVNKGELFGIIGPDGAGKTSLFRVLTTLLLPDGGSASVEGYDVVKDYKAIRRIAGYMPGKFSLYQDLTVEENLNFFATIFNTSLTANYELIKDIYVQIEPFKTRRAGKLSGGMKQKLALCCALIHKPAVLFLDEPTTGVDAVSRKEFWEMLKGLKAQGITILVSTPYMDEASLCDRVALIQGGQILSTGTPASIVEAFKQTLAAVRSDRMYELLKDLSAYDGVEDAYTFGAWHHAILTSNDTVRLKQYLENKGHHNVAVAAVQPTIEDCFMQLMQHKHD